MNQRKALIVASVASMISQFNIPNIKLMQKMGYEVHVACNYIDAGTISPAQSKMLLKYLQELNVKTYQIDFSRNPINFFRMIKAYMQLRRIMKNSYQLVHSHSPIAGALTRLAANQYRDNLKSIYTAHGFHFYKGSFVLNWLTFYPIEKILSRITDVLITINHEDYDLAKKNMKAAEIIYIPGVGLDTSKLDRKKKNIRESLGLSDEDYVITYVGELNNNKNQKVLINATKLLVDEIPNIKLLLVGKGINEKSYKDMIHNLQLDNNVKLLGYRDDVQDILHVSDLYVAPSIREGLPVNVMEAMYVGLPIIASENRGHKDLIINNMNGYLIKNEVMEYKTRILELFYDRDKSGLFGINGKLHIEKFTLMNIIKKYEKIYEI